VPDDELGQRVIAIVDGHRHTERIGRPTLVVGPVDRAVWTFARPVTP
jgi:hypothetical protein